ncbi:TorD/DmsD family molecular chaperone [Rivibacter subsaxonicus]|uniref:TorA maturation chaperone TorD n=1 Tax=Rivibacter subsaxonicus TaxID=457575 RepID=A0A4Q7VMS5_9BURK|nr:molecular chaperone TorD family protein [Rivibacter subsaxonicus]RZT97631.1 TorA maturation chaperone TorD [Rivibacter subsaxonicus]
MKPQPIAFAERPDEREELARAEVYGLLAALFYAAPSTDLYAQIQVAATEAPAPGALLESSWQEVVAASRRLPREVVAREYDALFQGVGKPEIFLFSSFHLAGAINDRPLVALRSDLAELGLERDPATTETEDHIAVLCELMRYLIAGADAAAGSLPSQQRFFMAHLAGWVEALTAQIAEHPKADFYRALALFARDFFAVERQGFDLLDL